MNSTSDLPTLVLATRNAHKAEEIRSILGAGFRYATLNDFPGAPNVIEDAPTFEGNAVKKAVELARWLAAQVSKPETRSSKLEARSPEILRGVTPGNEPEPGLLVLADDSGLEVDSLNGAPGVHSARFAALDAGTTGNMPDTDNNTKLLRLLKDVPLESRTARFRCALALTPVVSATPQGSSPVCYADEFEMQTQLFEGACEGRIGFHPKGRGGFGYDPLFLPEGREQTFGELGEEVKNRLSHRAQALLKLKTALQSAGIASPISNRPHG
jgi:XTP/dITP diphosphohydrolase